MLEVLRLPHLVLADIRHDESISLGQIPEIVNDMSCPEIAAVG